jgi:hypothetical protein
MLMHGSEFFLIHFTVLGIPIQLFKTIHQFTLLKIFAFAFKFAAKKLGGAVGRLMDYSICRLLYVVFVCVSLYHTIP